jgi:DNA-binding MarR family transcriptional regulator
MAAGLRVSKPAITRALDRLMELGLGTRITDARDRRSVYFQPSGAGVKLARSMGAQVA